MLDLIEAHVPQWQQMQRLLQKKRLPQAFLFVGPRHAGILQFANHLMANLVCENLDKPCRNCRSCHLLTQNIHPDINYIRQENLNSAIKIESIRELQQDVYQTPKRGLWRFVVIEAAHKMNTSAANALLKVLEEPPKHTIFILIAEQVNSIPATILSRCQKYNFHSQESVVDYLSLGQYYPSNSSRAELLQQNLATIITELCDLIEERISPCKIAEKWSNYVFDDLLWLLYLVTAQTIRYHLLGVNNLVQETRPLLLFVRSTSPMNLLNQIGQINAIMKKINHNININQTLVLEDLLLGYLN